MTSKPELKSCPHCRFSVSAMCAVLHPIGGLGGSFFNQYYACCPVCLMRGPEKPTRAGAKLAWNKLPRNKK